MSQTEEIPRTVPGVELFFGESVAQYLAEISEEAYSAESSAEGFLLGKRFTDPQGEYAVVSGVTQDVAKAGQTVGWFRSSESGNVVTPGDLSKIYTLFGYSRVYVIIIDSSAESMAMYVAENGVARKVKSVMVENL